MLRKDVFKIVIIAILSFLSFAIFGLADPTIKGDSGGYINLAENIMEKGGLMLDNGEPTNYREPGYPLFLAGIFSVFGKGNMLAVKLVQFVLFLILALSFYFTASKYFKNKNIAFVSVAIFSLFPSFGFYNGRILSEALFIFLFGLTILFLIRAYYSDKKLISVLLGATLGLSAMVKASSLIIIFLVFLFFIFEKKFKKAILVLIFSFLIITPWVARNFYHFGNPSVTSGRQEDHYFAVAKIVDELSSADIAKLAFLKIKKGFQSASEEETIFLNKYNENKIIRENNDLVNFKNEHPTFGPKEIKNYSLKVIKKYPIKIGVNTFFNFASTLGPEIPTVIKDNEIFTNNFFKKIFFIFYLLLYLAVYIVNLLFLLEILFKPKKEFILYYLFYAIALLVLGAYSFFIFCTRFNTPMFILYILLFGLYFDYKYKEKSFAL